MTIILSEEEMNEWLPKTTIVQSHFAFWNGQKWIDDDEVEQ